MTLQLLLILILFSPLLMGMFVVFSPFILIAFTLFSIDILRERIKYRKEVE